MRDKPLVSVVIIFLNAEQFIKEAIESVFAQTYANWELFLVDDGSTDGSTEIALQYATEHPHRIWYLEHENHRNRGMSASRNCGIRKAKGVYIGFLDADDVWFPNKLEQQVEILESCPEAVMVYGAAQFWYSWTGNSNDVDRDFIQKLDIQPNQLIQPPALVTLFLKNGGASPSPSGVLLRPDAIERVGGFEEVFWAGTQMYDDQAFYFKVGIEAPVFVANECWYKYRIHADSHCVVAYNAGQHHNARLAFLRWLKAHFSKKRVRDRDVWRALRRALHASELKPYCHPVRYRLFDYIRRLTASFERLVRAVLRRALPAPIRLWLRGYR